MAFVCKSPDQEFAALDIPLAYIRSEKFNQPIFGCNNLSGNVFSVDNGGPSGSAPPWEFTIYFKEGGCGTFLPIFLGQIEAARNGAQRATEGVPEEPSAPYEESVIQTAYVDPNDPSTLYVVQPNDENRIEPQSGYPTLRQASTALRTFATAV
eukprot:CAMPEP_0196583230 /NCGR_PEP_ID=MMETSP1081-20130531/42576_1 /TAXON_ID=36882 /ORGANISM="Pyramimonas amylifera, Strain CCMP720" /LENGTH=152 /DNA_ID=CAMNT_0041904047 /DNA_START=159 /DNA_END=613 /DNA_ORIENTATION=+